MSRNGRKLALSADLLVLLERLNPPILRGLTPDDLAEILAQARLRKVEKHTILIHEGHSATRMYLLLEGMDSLPLLRRMKST